MLETTAARVIARSTKLFTGGTAHWKGCRPENRQRIFVANHTSHLDFVLLWAMLPAEVRRRTRPVAAADYWDRGVVRRYLARRVFRAILVRRGGTRDPREPDPMVEALQHGDSLILFPEGTRGDGGQLLAFKSGVFHLAAARPEAEVIPVWLNNLHRAMPKGAFLIAPMICSANFGEPVGIAANESKQQFLARLQDAVLDLARVAPRAEK